MFKKLLSKFRYNKKAEINFFISSVIQEYEKQTGKECEAILSEESRLIIDGFEFNIATTFELYKQSDKSSKSKFIEMLIKNILITDEVEDFELVKDKIVPIVRPIAYHEIMQLQMDIDHKVRLMIIICLTRKLPLICVLFSFSKKRAMMIQVINILS